VAIPAKDEEALLPRCLAALGRQTGVAPAEVGVVVCLNNTTDRSLEATSAVARGLACAVTIVEVTLEPDRAHAGWARRLAMETATTLCLPIGLLLTTDADAVADDDWIAQNHHEIANGVDAVAGFVTADWEELQQLDSAILDRGALEWEYQNLLAAHEARLDPCAWDPAPRPNQMCGASLAVSKTAYDAVGGLPPLPVGEDRALFQALLARDYRIRHSLKAHVTASARTIGRAYGGMADALRLRHDPDYPCDDILESVERASLRWRLRHRLRASWGRWNLDAIATELGVQVELVQTAASHQHFGSAWAMLEQRVPALQADLVTARSLPDQLDTLRALAANYPADPPHEADPARLSAAAA
jgi:hypothetical protein